MTVEELIVFERDIASEFNRGAIRAPIHLSGNNEQQLINYFNQNYDAARGDWVFSSWRSHYHCLLAGVPPQRLRADILAGRSITLTYPDHRVVSSAIVGGALPIALGVALSLQRQWDAIRVPSGKEITAIVYVSRPIVHCFLGDMTARTGIFHECRDYACGWDLPITFIIEDNGKSVMTDTEAVWGPPAPEHSSITAYWQETVGDTLSENFFKTVRYKYSLPWPHAGAGKRVMF